MNPFSLIGDGVKHVGSTVAKIFISTSNSEGVRSLADKNVQAGLDAINHPAVKNVYLTIVNNNGSGTINVHPPQDPWMGPRPTGSITDSWSLLEPTETLSSLVISFLFSYGLYLYKHSLDLNFSNEKHLKYNIELELKIWNHIVISKKIDSSSK